MIATSYRSQFDFKLFTSREFIWISLIILLSLIVKLVINANSIGSNDIVNWYNSASLANTYGIIEAYKNDAYSNNPPLSLSLAVLLLKISQLLEIRFSFLFKLVQILADSLIAYGIGWLLLQKFNFLKANIYTLLFAFNPISILLSSYHGHTDSFCISLSFYSVLMMIICKKYFLSGALLSLALQIKIIPLLLIPAFLRAFEDRSSFLRWVSGGIIFSLPSFYLLFNEPATILSKILGYRSVGDYWGIAALIKILATNNPNFSKLDDYLPILNSLSPFIILITVVFFAHRIGRDFKNEFINFANSYTIMGLLATGFSITYSYYLLPFYYLISPLFGLSFSLIVGATLLSTYSYYLVSVNPIQTVHFGTSPKLIVLLTFLIWSSLLYFVVMQLELNNKNK
jgi:hypothetical protein